MKFSLLKCFFLFWIKIKLFVFEKLTFFHLKTRYDNDRFFKVVDTLLLEMYRKDSPYRLSRNYLKAKGEKQVYVYGETPRYVFEKIFSRWGPFRGEMFVDLGSGTGRALFMGALMFSGRYLGIEQIPQFVEKALQLRRRYSLKGVEFIEGDYKKISLAQGDLFYYFCLCESDEDVRNMCDKFAVECKKKARWITVSFPLSDIDERFTVKDKIKGIFPWGKSFLYLNALKKEE